MLRYKLINKFILVLTLFSGGSLYAQVTPDDSLEKKKTYPFFYNWSDARLNKFNYTTPPLLNISPSAQKSTVLFNPNENNFSLTEKVNDKFDNKVPQSMSFSDYSTIQNNSIKRSIIRDIEKAQDGYTSTGGKDKPNVEKNSVFDRIFGGKLPEFKPNGYLGFNLTWNKTFIDNPSTYVALRHQSTFYPTFENGINFNNFFNGTSSNPINSANGAFDQNNPNIGNRSTDVRNIMSQSNMAREKMNIMGNYDTKSSFAFENRFKINFKNDPEDILQKVELGNISMPNRSQLIPGVQNLLGAKLGFRFGKLDITTVFAQQRSRTESIMVNGGNQSRPFEIKCDNYEENKHFFLAQFFRENYERSLKNLPILTSGVKITRVEVYVTNRINAGANIVGSGRNVFAASDFGETMVKETIDVANSKTLVPVANDNTPLFKTLAGNPNYRSVDQTFDIEKAEPSLKDKAGINYDIQKNARRLTSTEFDFNSDLGYISLLTPIRNDEMIAVAFEYTYNGVVHKVGEMTEDYAIRGPNDVIFLKLVKSTTVRTHLDSPMWDLMLKNIYALPTTQVKKEGFQMRIIYKDDKTGLDLPNLQDGDLNKHPLIRVMRLDKLNFNLDPYPDGNFDFIEGITINSKLGKVIFPVLEPFGSHLADSLKNDATSRDKYVFSELYAKTMTDAQQVTTKNKFFISGSVQGGGGDIALPMGVSASSVRVYVGGEQLKQGTDYMVDAQLGVLRFTNQSILSSGRAIRIDYEKPDMFQTQIRRLFATRLDYMVGRDLHLGGTFMNLRENTTGNVTRAAIGNEPVNNTIWGIDMNLKKQSYALTKALDKLPGIQTKAMSSILLNAEFAQLIPGVNNKKVNNSSMIDDFEYSRNINDLAKQPAKWRLGSVPVNLRNGNDNNRSINDNRAKISVYNIDPSLYISGGNSNIPSNLAAEANGNLYEKPFQVQDIFPGRSLQVFGQQLPTTILDIAYFPQEPGMYNYNSNLDNNGLLPDPKKSFGSITRGITFDTDFDNTNVEFIEMWMLDPFKDIVKDGINNKQNTTGGTLKIHLGNVSEDVIPDHNFGFENGITEENQGKTTEFGKVSTISYITDAFNQDEATRKRQDVGLDGLSNADEQNFFSSYLTNIKGIPATAYEDINKDPSKDDFKYFLDPSFSDNASLLQRYKNYLGMENNSPVVNGTGTTTLSVITTADKEDLNQDNTINETESYFEYEIPLNPINGKLDDKTPYIADKVSNGNAEWYLLRIPIRNFGPKSTNTDVSGLKSVRFIRLVTTDWKEPVVMRFAALQLVSNTYRNYQYQLTGDSSGINKPYQHPSTIFNTSTVNIEENGCDNNGNCNIKPGETPYVVPPGFIRDRDYTSQAVVKFNEQSLKLSVNGLLGGDSRAAYKNTKLDLNMYQRIKMFVHAEKPTSQKNGIKVFMRIGTDLVNNYYEIESDSLEYTAKADSSNTGVWPAQNEFDIPLDLLRQVKGQRNNDHHAIDKVYPDIDIPISVDGTQSSNGLPITRNYKIRVIGNPDLSTVLTMMVGIKNNDKTDIAGKDAIIWVDELRAYKFNTKGGNAAIMSADIKLADIGTLSINGSYRGYGFGTVQDKISNRSRDVSKGFGIASSLALDKFLPLSWGLSIPFYGNFDQQRIVPHFNPLDPDMLLGDPNSLFGDKIKGIASDVTTTKGFNFTNVRKLQTNLDAKNHFYSIENFTFSYAFNQITRHNISIENYNYTQRKAALGYVFQPKEKIWKPFSKHEKYNWVKDFNVSLRPTSITFRTDYSQSFMSTTYRNVDFTKTSDTTSTSKFVKSDPFVIKYFLANRVYNVQWQLTKSLSFMYDALNQSIQDDKVMMSNNEISFGSGLFMGGRTKNYTQRMQALWKIPLNRAFITDWISADAKYVNNFGFTAGSYQLADDKGQLFGNLIQNGREIGVNGQVDFVKLYNKFAGLRNANTPKGPIERFARAPGNEEILKSPNNNLKKNILRVLMTLRGVNMSFSKVETTLLPGFLPRPSVFGLDRNNQFAPGFAFVTGNQSYDILNKADRNGWISHAIMQNNPFTQTRGFKFEYNTSLEPINGLKIQVKGNLMRADVYKENFAADSLGSMQHYSKVRTGNFSMSYISYKGFGGIKNNSNTGFISQLYNQMLKNRDQVISILNNIQTKRNNNKPISDTITYTKMSQDVLIPAFFSAYSGMSLNKLFKNQDKGQSFNPFFKIPLPNWRIDYTGAEKLPILRNYFKTITFSHQYTSTFSVGNYTSNLSYTDINYIGLKRKAYALGNIVDISGIYIPTFIMSAISMETKFSPLIGVQFQTKKKITGMMNLNKAFSSVLDLSNGQVVESNNFDYQAGIGFIKNNVKLPLRSRDGNYIVLKNDLNVRFDISYKNNIRLIRQIDGPSIPTVTYGAKEFAFSPTMTYQINERINIGMNWKKTIINPFTSTAYYQNMSIFNFNARFNLTDTNKLVPRANR